MMKTRGCCFTLYLISALLLGSCSENITGQGSALGLPCNFLDITAPVFASSLTESLPAAITKSPEYSWTDAVDQCEIHHYEIAIGTTPGGTDNTNWTSIGNVTTYRATGLSLNDVIDYYYSVRAVDGAGNISSAITSPAWNKLDPVSDLPNLILRLNADDKASVLDGGGFDANNGGFAGTVQNWLDTSGSANIHDWFSAAPANRPNYILAETALQFDGATKYMTVADHTDLNLGTVNQRNFTVAFETGANIAARQVVYEEGATVRGMNVYIDNGNIYCGFWNTNNDGDGAQPFVSVSAPIAANTRYSVTWVFNYLNYTGAAGPDGSLSCYLNGTQIGATQASTSKLYAHSGDLGIGAQIDGSYYHNGSSGGGPTNYFFGKIFEVMIVVSVPTPTDLTIVNEYLSDKWNL